MANIKGSQLPENTAPSGNDTVFGIDSTVSGTKRTKLSTLLSWIFNNALGYVNPQNLVSGAGTNWAMVDYGSSSTVTGWSAFINKKIRYCQVGKMIFVYFDFSGTSNSTSVSFTLPFTQKTLDGSSVGLEAATGLAINNGTTDGAPGRVFIDNNVNGSLVIITRLGGSNGWTASGSKIVRGQFFIEIA